MLQTFCDILWLYFLVLSNVQGNSNVRVYSNLEAALYDLAKFL